MRQTRSPTSEGMQLWHRVKLLPKVFKESDRDWREAESKVLILLILYFNKKNFPATHKEIVFYRTF